MAKENKIMIVGTLEAIIDTADEFLKTHPQATLQDFIKFLREMQNSYLCQGEEKKQ